MKTTKEKIAVMQAYLDGKTIQDNTCGHWTDWENSQEPDFNWASFDYRIKPENKQVPFDFSDAESLINRVFKHKTSGFTAVCTWIDDSLLYLGPSEIDFKTLANNWLIKNETLKQWLPCTKTVNN